MRLSRIRVRAGWVAGLAVLVLARPSVRSVLVSLPLALLGEALRLWASGHIEKTRALATGGPYAHTRNPLYLGSVLMALAVAVAAWSPWAVAVVLAYFLLFYPAVIREESAFLARTFGDDYARWAGAVPVFLPRLTPGGPRASRFSWERLRGNREWKAALALPAALLLLGLRQLLWP